MVPARFGARKGRYCNLPAAYGKIKDTLGSCCTYATEIAGDCGCLAIAGPHHRGWGNARKSPIPKGFLGFRKGTHILI